MKCTVALLIALANLLSGCATTPMQTRDAKQAPRDRVLAFQAKTSEATGTLVVIRDSGFTGSGCFLAVWINGKVAARLDVGEISTFFVPPGEVLLRSGRDQQGKGLCAFDLENWTQRETTLRPGETKTFRLSLDTGGKTDLQRADQ